MPKSKTAKRQTVSPSGKSHAVQTIEQLRQRYELLNETKIKVQTQREHTARRLAELKQSARDEFGTDDVQQLQRKLDEMKAANDTKRREYQMDLDRIEQQLAELDEKFAEAELDDAYSPQTALAKADESKPEVEPGPP